MSSQPVVSYKYCKGNASWGTHSLDVEFDFTFGKRTEIRFAFKDIAAAAANAEVLALYTVYRSNQSSIESLRLEATTPEGHRLRTESLYLTAASLYSGQTGTHLKFEGSAGTVNIIFRDCAAAEDRGRIVFHTQGQRAFGPGVTATCDLGTVSVRGDPSPDDFNELTGCVIFDAERLRKVDLMGWAGRCENRFDLLLEVFSIGEGRRIRWGLKNTYFGSELMHVRLVSLGKADKPFQPMFPYLNLRPVLEFALNNYTRELRDTLGIQYAVAWFLMAHAYTEVRYVAGMTAIEHLVSKYIEAHVPKGRRGILSKAVAQPVRRALRETLDKSIGSLKGKGVLRHEDEQRARPLLEDAVNNVNKKPLRVQLRDMLAFYGVPLDGLDEHLDRMVRARNDIVHRGFHESGEGDDRLRFLEDVLRELLKRIFLQILGYRGRYDTWFRQHAYVEFQPGKPQASLTKPFPWWQRFLFAFPFIGRRLRHVGQYVSPD